MRALNLPALLERLLVDGDEPQRAVAREALALLGALAAEDALADHVVTNPRLLELLTQLEALDLASVRAEESGPPLFGAVARVLDVLPELETESGVERLFRVLHAALGSRPPRLWRSLVTHLQNNDLAREVLAAVQGVFLLLAYARLEARADAHEIVAETGSPSSSRRNPRGGS